MPVLLVLVAVAMGSFPTGVVLTHGTVEGDIRSRGSGNTGAANVARNAGFKAGAMVALIDILKGAIPVILAQWWGAGEALVFLVALAAVLGHDFSIFLHFRGGKGVATTLGVALALAPAAALIAVGLWVAVIAVWRYSSLASLVALTILPVLVAMSGRPPAYVWTMFVLFLVGAAKHWENILRLVAGREQKFGGPRLTGDA
ncbi:MAG: glycerol-3-phosphate 1-O-acyltransferase PlsY [Chloroflexota bacterium]